MEESVPDELMEIAQKARITPNDSFDHANLEHLLRVFLDWKTFPPNTLRDLLDQYTRLSLEEQSALVERAQKRTHPSRLHMPDDDANKMYRAREELTLAQRIQLSSVQRVYGGVAWVDVGEAFTAAVEIDDHSSMERRKRPFAHVFFSDGYTLLVETVDILGSVKKNTSAIGHPAIIAAVRHWQNVLYSKHIHMRSNHDDKKPMTKALRYHFTRQNIEVAERNLNALSTALLSGATKSGITKKRALAFNLAELDLDNQQKVLYRVWTKFRDWQIPTPSETAEIEGFRAKIWAENVSERSGLKGVDPENICEFLMDGGRTGGFRFRGGSVKSRKAPVWEEFRNAFAAWYFHVGVNTIKNCAGVAKKEPVDKDKVSKIFSLPPEFPVTRLLSQSFLTPLVFVREPIRINKGNIHLSIEEAILAKLAVTGKKTKEVTPTG